MAPRGRRIAEACGATGRSVRRDGGRAGGESQGRPMSVVGLVTHSGAAQDVRRITSLARTIDVHERVNVTARVLAGLAAVPGVRVLYLSEPTRLVERALATLAALPEATVIDARPAAAPEGRGAAQTRRTAAALADGGGGVRRHLRRRRHQPGGGGGLARRRDRSPSRAAPTTPSPSRLTRPRPGWPRRSTPRIRTPSPAMSGGCRDGGSPSPAALRRPPSWTSPW